MSKPLLCVVVTAATTGELRQKRDAVADADLIELRLDTVSDPDVAGALEGRRRPVIVTCRAAWEGGGFRGSEDERERILADALSLGAEYVDVEWRARFDDLIAGTGGKRIVLSTHDYDGVPADLTKPVSDLAGTITISQSSINSLLRLPGATGDLTLGEGTIKYDGTTQVLGLSIGYTVTVVPTADGESILLKPTKAEVTTGGGNLDLSRLLGTVVGSKPLSVCVAQYLPKGVTVDDVTVKPGAATIHLAAHDLVLSQETLATKGSCS